MNTKTPMPEWYGKIRSYRHADNKSAVLQLLGSVGAFVALWAGSAVLFVSGVPYLLVAISTIPAALAHIRVFILFHDCCHGSLFPSRRWNTIVGHLTGVLTLTNFETWRKSHLKHHGTNAQLDHRGTGDVWTMTVTEYQNAPLYEKIRYRLFRTPVVMFLIGPAYLFIFKYRFSRLRAGWKERKSTIITNLGLAAIATAVSIAIGFTGFLLILLPVVAISGLIGVWLFYVQHQFSPGYWARDEEWNQVDAALQGSSYYNLPRFFQWLFGYITIHHIHHLQPHIPNYRLRACYRENPEVQVKKPLSVLESLSSLKMKLWSESTRKFLSFQEYGKLK